MQEMQQVSSMITLLLLAIISVKNDSKCFFKTINDQLKDESSTVYTVIEIPHFHLFYRFFTSLAGSI